MHRTDRRVWTLVSEIERAGYARDLGSGHVAPPAAKPGGLARHPAGPNPAARWRQVSVDRQSQTVTRPAGLRLDTGGIAKGLFGGVLAALLSLHDGFVVAAAGDVRLGGKSGMLRPIEVTSPFEEGEILHTFELARGALATSGTTTRSWIDERGQIAHHLLDPATGSPAFTGVVQVTALARSGMEAEALAKAALLSGPGAAVEWLPHGGIVAHEDGMYEVIEPVRRRATA